MVKSIRNFFKLKKENEVAKNIIIKYIRMLFEQEYNCYEPTRVGNFWNNTCIKYENNGDGNKNVSVKEYLNKIKPYLRDIIIDIQKSDLSKVQLAIGIEFTSSEDIDEERVIHSQSDSKEFKIYDNAYDVLDELFKSLLSRYQSSLETLRRGNDFIFNSVQFLYYKCRRINLGRGVSCIDSPDWIKKEKAT